MGIITVGIGLIWYGLKSEQQITENKIPLVSEATSSARPLTPKHSDGERAQIGGERILVTEVIDGDTIKVSSGQTVRLLGIDTPETKDPRRPVGCFGKEASNEVKSLLEGRKVLLEKDISDTDKYGRLLRYIYLPLDPSTGSGKVLFVNDYLVREGFATVYTYPPDVKYNEQLREAESKAREGNKGLWGRC